MASRCRRFWLFMFLCSVWTGVFAKISDLRFCGDPKCEEPVSMGRTLIQYSSADPDIMSFRKNVKVMIFSKSAGTNQDLWGGEINGKRGYIPKSFVREEKIFRKPNHVVPTNENAVTNANISDASPSVTKSSPDHVVGHFDQKPYNDGLKENAEKHKQFNEQEVSAVGYDAKRESIHTESISHQEHSSEDKIGETSHSTQEQVVNDAILTTGSNDLDNNENPGDADMSLANISNSVMQLGEDDESSFNVLQKTWVSVKETNLLALPWDSLQTAAVVSNKLTNTLFKGFMASAESIPQSDGDHPQRNERHIVVEGTQLPFDMFDTEMPVDSKMYHGRNVGDSKSEESNQIKASSVMESIVEYSSAHETSNAGISETQGSDDGKLMADIGSSPETSKIGTPDLGIKTSDLEKYGDVGNIGTVVENPTDESLNVADGNDEEKVNREISVTSSNPSQIAPSSSFDAPKVSETPELMNTNSEIDVGKVATKSEGGDDIRPTAAAGQNELSDGDDTEMTTGIMGRIGRTLFGTGDEQESSSEVVYSNTAPSEHMVRNSIPGMGNEGSQGLGLPRNKLPSDDDFEFEEEEEDDDEDDDQTEEDLGDSYEDSSESPESVHSVEASTSSSIHRQPEPEMTEQISKNEDTGYRNSFEKNSNKNDAAHVKSSDSAEEHISEVEALAGSANEKMVESDIAESKMQDKGTYQNIADHDGKERNAKSNSMLTNGEISGQQENHELESSVTHNLETEKDKAHLEAASKPNVKLDATVNEIQPAMSEVTTPENRNVNNEVMGSYEDSSSPEKGNAAIDDAHDNSKVGNIESSVTKGETMNSVSETVYSRSGTVDSESETIDLSSETVDSGSEAADSESETVLTSHVEQTTTETVLESNVLTTVTDQSPSTELNANSPSGSGMLVNVETMASEDAVGEDQIPNDGDLLSSTETYQEQLPSSEEIDYVSEQEYDDTGYARDSAKKEEDLSDDVGWLQFTIDFDIKGIAKPYVDFLRPYIQLIVDLLPEPLRIALIEMEVHGLSPRVVVFTGLNGLFLMIFLIVYSYINKGNKEGNLTVKLCSYDKKLFEATTERDILREEVTSSNEKITELETTLSELQEKTTLLEADLMSSTEEGQRLQDSLQRVQQQLNKQKATIADLESNVESKKERNDSLLNTNEEAATKIAQLEETILQLESELDESRKESHSSKYQVEQLEVQVNSLQVSNNQLLVEAKVWDQSVRELQQQVEVYHTSTEELQEKLSLQVTEVEYLKEGVMQLKLIQDDASDDGTETAIEKLRKLMDVFHMSAALKAAEVEKSALVGEHEVAMLEYKSLQEELASLKDETEHLRQNHSEMREERDEAQTKLQVLSNYFKEKETALQRELGMQQAKRQQTEDDATSVSQRAVLFEQEISLYKSQVVTLKKEIESQERSFKTQMSAHEKKAHENWLAARAAERKSEEAKQEAAQLRNRLTLLEKEKETILWEQVANAMKPAPKRYGGSNGEVPSPTNLGGESVFSISGPPSLIRDPLDSPHGPPFLPLDRPLPPPSMSFPFFRDRLPPPPMPPFDVHGPPLPPGMFDPRMGPLPPPISGRMLPMMDRRMSPPPHRMSPPPYDRSSPPPRDYRSPPPSDRRLRSPPPYSRRPPAGRRISPPDDRRHRFPRDSSPGSDRDRRSWSPPPPRFYDIPPPPGQHAHPSARGPPVGAVPPGMRTGPPPIRREPGYPINVREGQSGDPRTSSPLNPNTNCPVNQKNERQASV